MSDGVYAYDMAIHNGKIVQIDKQIKASLEDDVIDATDCYVMPGAIDPHTHFEMTNALATTADDFESGSLAAVMGGTTSIINFASPYEGSLLKGLKKEQHKAEGRCYCNYKFHMEILDVNDSILRELREVCRQGVTSFKVYMAYDFSIDDGSIYRLLKALHGSHALVAAHCENGELIQALKAELIERDHMDITAHPLSKPALVEAEAIHRFISIGQLADYPVHIVHVSSAEGLREIEIARRKGAAVTCETCSQYLTLTDEVYKRPRFEGGKYVMSPPLRKQSDVDILRAAVKRGMFQTLATDHCSYTYQQKQWGQYNFTKIPGGIPGVEERVILLYHILCHEEGMSVVDYMKLISENPAKLYGMYPAKGKLGVGCDADITMIHKHKQTMFTNESIHSKAMYTPYEGFTCRGKIEHVIINGEHVVKEGKLVCKSQGKYIG